MAKTKSDLQQELEDLKAELAEREESRILQQQTIEDLSQKLQAKPDPMAGHLLTKMNTDEGREERDAKLREEGRLSEGPKITVTSSPFEKSIEQMADQMSEGRQPWETADPFADTMEAHVPEGHVGRFLGDAQCKLHGLRGWNPVRDADGKLITVGGMTLGSMPKEKAEQRKKHFRDKAKARLRKTIELHREAQQAAEDDDLDTPGNHLTITRSAPMVTRTVATR